MLSDTIINIGTEIQTQQWTIAEENEFDICCTSIEDFSNMEKRLNQIQKGNPKKFLKEVKRKINEKIVKETLERSVGYSSNMKDIYQTGTQKIEISTNRRGLNSNFYFEKKLKSDSLRMARASQPIINQPDTEKFEDDFDQCEYKVGKESNDNLSFVEGELEKKENIKESLTRNLIPFFELKNHRIYDNNLRSMKILRERNKGILLMENPNKFYSTKFLKTKSILKPSSFDERRQSIRQGCTKSVTPEKSVHFNRNKLVYKFQKERKSKSTLRKSQKKNEGIKRNKKKKEKNELKMSLKKYLFKSQFQRNNTQNKQGHRVKNIQLKNLLDEIKN